MAKEQGKKKRKVKQRMVEVSRSYSFKKNLGNYEMADFFCSQKAECRPQDVEAVSEALYAFCKAEVVKSVNQFMSERNQYKTGEKPKVEREEDAMTTAELDAGQVDFGDDGYDHPFDN